MPPTAKASIDVGHFRQICVPWRVSAFQQLIVHPNNKVRLYGDSDTRGSFLGEPPSPYMQACTVCSKCSDENYYRKVFLEVTEFRLDLESKERYWLRSKCVSFRHDSVLAGVGCSSRPPDWKKHKLESRLPGEISITSGMQTTPPLWQKVKKH